MKLVWIGNNLEWSRDWNWNLNWSLNWNLAWVLKNDWMLTSGLEINIWNAWVYADGISNGNVRIGCPTKKVHDYIYTSMRFL